MENGNSTGQDITGKYYSGSETKAESMDTPLASVLSAALIIVGGITLSRGFSTFIDSFGLGFKQASIKVESIVRTQLSFVEGKTLGQNRVEITLRNIGETKVRDFAKWDFIVQYTDINSQSQVRWLSYVSGIPTSNQWKVKSIYFERGEETEGFEPGAINPGEDVILQAKLSPAIKRRTSIMVNIATPSGIAVSSIFTDG